MRRRVFIATIGSIALAISFDAFAQRQSGQMRKVGLLMETHESDPVAQQQMMNFRSTLATLGWVNGRDISLEIRWYSGESTRANQYARVLGDLAPDVIVVTSTMGLEAGRSATREIPIVFVNVTDPVGARYVESLEKPGGNITGFSSFDAETGGKWLEIIKEAVPAVNRVGVLMDPEYAGYMARWRAMETLGPSFKVELSMVAIRASADIENAIATFAREPNSALIVFSSAITSANRNLIIDLVARHRLPTIYPFKNFTERGGLISYGIDPLDIFQRAASYADRILRGTSLGELPVQAPTKFELVINAKTAKALGLTIPPSQESRAVLAPQC